MSYKTTTLVSRSGYSSTDGIWDSFKSAAGKGWNIVAGGEQAKGQSALLKGQLAWEKQQRGQLPTWLLPAAVAGVAIFLYTRKK